MARFPRNVEDLFTECGIDIGHETVGYWCNRFGPTVAVKIPKRRGYRHWRWHLNEAFVKINGMRGYLDTSVDHVRATLANHQANNFKGLAGL